MPGLEIVSCQNVLYSLHFSHSHQFFLLYFFLKLQLHVKIQKAFEGSILGLTCKASFNSCRGKILILKFKVMQKCNLDLSHFSAAGALIVSLVPSTHFRQMYRTSRSVLSPHKEIPVSLVHPVIEWFLGPHTAETDVSSYLPASLPFQLILKNTHNLSDLLKMLKPCFHDGTVFN